MNKRTPAEKVSVSKEGSKDNGAFIEVSEVNKIFKPGQMKVDALKNISFTINSGEFIALGGSSGAGKSTLLHLLGGLDRPSSGRIRIGDLELQKMDEEALTLFRKENVGFVFQFFNLIPSLTALENVMISHIFEPASEDENVWKRAVSLLEQMGLDNRLEHRPAELSGGEQQRVAIARALLNRPRLLLADEPTGNIDTEAGDEIMKLFGDLNSKGTTVVVATHDRDVKDHAGRVLELKDGLLRSDTVQKDR